MTYEQKVYQIQRLVNGKAGRMTRKQSTIGWYLLDARYFVKKYPENPAVTIEQALEAAQAVAAHKGRWDDSLKPLLDKVAAFLVSIGK